MWWRTFSKIYVQIYKDTGQMQMLSEKKYFICKSAEQRQYNTKLRKCIKTLN